MPDETKEQIIRAADYIDNLVNKELKSLSKCDCAFIAIMAYISMKHGTFDDVWNGILVADQVCDIPGSDKLLDSLAEKEVWFLRNHEEEYRKLGLTEESRERFDLPSYKLWATIINKTIDDWLGLLEKCLPGQPDR